MPKIDYIPAFSDMLTRLGNRITEKDARIAQLEAALKAVEWIQMADSPSPHSWVCEICCRTKPSRHKDNCIVGIALRGEE